MQHKTFAGHTEHTPTRCRATNRTERNDEEKQEKYESAQGTIFLSSLIPGLHSGRSARSGADEQMEIIGQGINSRSLS